MDTVEITYFDRAAVQGALDAYVRLITALHPEIEEVMLFGSLASGTPVPGSDVDVLLVLSETDRSFLARIPQFLPSGFPVDIDVFPYTRDEIERMKRDRSGLILSALREGRTLFTRCRPPTARDEVNFGIPGA